MKIRYNPKLKQLARNLQNNSTLSEVLLWNELKGKQVGGNQFLRQKPMGNFIADFFCPKLKLVIEVDGDSHEDQKVQERDKKKDQYLNSIGITVLRYDDLEIKQNLTSVIDHLIDWIDKKEKTAP